jgi:quercetin dioxygenase-like cupin family protein
MNKPNVDAPERANNTAGVVKAGNGQYYFDFGTIQQIKGGGEYSTAFGGCVEGERMMVALMRMPAGTGSEPHSHPNEQWIYLLEGEMDFIVDGKSKRATAGSVIYIPSNTIHNARVGAKQDAVFFTVKDTSWGLAGVKV